MKRALILFALSLAIIVVGAMNRGTHARGPGGSLASRLLGPVRGVASSVQWIRFDAARRDGHFDLAYARAETALRLDPSSSAGWMLLARHLAFDRGSPGGSASASERLTWLKAGLEILERGKPHVRRPAELALAQASFMAAQAGYAAEDCVWPGGPRVCFEEAARFFEQAGEYELALSARELADEQE